MRMRWIKSQHRLHDWWVRVRMPGVRLPANPNNSCLENELSNLDDLPSIAVEWFWHVNERNRK